MPAYDLSNHCSDVPSAFVEESRKTLRGSFDRITHCVDQLSEEDVWWRPTEAMNAIGNLLLHVNGNLRMWLLAPLKNETPKRDRPAEFAERRPIPKDELMRALRQTVDECDGLMAGLEGESSLLARRNPQGFDTCVLGAIYHAVTHFEGHAQEIIYITRLRRGAEYRFLWTPATPSQVAATA